MKAFRVQEDLHKMVFDKKNEIKKNNGVELTVESIVDNILRNEISKYELGKYNKKVE